MNHPNHHHQQRRQQRRQLLSKQPSLLLCLVVQLYLVVVGVLLLLVVQLPSAAAVSSSSTTTSRWIRTSTSSQHRRLQGFGTVSLPEFGTSPTTAPVSTTTTTTTTLPVAATTTPAATFLPTGAPTTAATTTVTATTTITETTPPATLTPTISATTTTTTLPPFGSVVVVVDTATTTTEAPQEAATTASLCEHQQNVSPLQHFPTEYNTNPEILPFVGIMFALDVKDKDVTVYGMTVDVRLDLLEKNNEQQQSPPEPPFVPLYLQVYVKEGTYRPNISDTDHPDGFASNASAWTLVFPKSDSSSNNETTNSNVLAAPLDAGVIFPTNLFTPTLLHANQKYSWYITAAHPPVTTTITTTTTTPALPALLDYTVNALDQTGDVAAFGDHFILSVGSAVSNTTTLFSGIDPLLDPQFAGSLYYTTTAASSFSDRTSAEEETTVSLQNNNSSTDCVYSTAAPTTTTVEFRFLTSSTEQSIGETIHKVVTRTLQEEYLSYNNTTTTETMTVLQQFVREHNLILLPDQTVTSSEPYDGGCPVTWETTCEGVTTYFSTTVTLSSSSSSLGNDDKELVYELYRTTQFLTHQVQQEFVTAAATAAVVSNQPIVSVFYIGLTSLRAAYTMELHGVPAETAGMDDVQQMYFGSVVTEFILSQTGSVSVFHVTVDNQNWKDTTTRRRRRRHLQAAAAERNLQDSPSAVLNVTGTLLAAKYAYFDDVQIETTLNEVFSEQNTFFSELLARNIYLPGEMNNNDQGMFFQRASATKAVIVVLEGSNQMDGAGNTIDDDLQNGFHPVRTETPPTKKKRIRIFIGVIAGLVVVVSACVVFFLYYLKQKEKQKKTKKTTTKKQNEENELRSSSGSDDDEEAPDDKMGTFYSSQSESNQTPAAATTTTTPTAVGATTAATASENQRSTHKTTASNEIGERRENVQRDDTTTRTKAAPYRSKSSDDAKFLKPTTNDPALPNEPFRKQNDFWGKQPPSSPQIKETGTPPPPTLGAFFSSAPPSAAKKKSDVQSLGPGVVPPRRTQSWDGMSAPSGPPVKRRRPQPNHQQMPGNPSLSSHMGRQQPANNDRTTTTQSDSRTVGPGVVPSHNSPRKKPSDGPGLGTRNNQYSPVNNEKPGGRQTKERDPSSPHGVARSKSEGRYQNTHPHHQNPPSRGVPKSRTGDASYLPAGAGADGMRYNNNNNNNNNGTTYLPRPPSRRAEVKAPSLQNYLDSDRQSSGRTPSGPSNKGPNSVGAGVRQGGGTSNRPSNNSGPKSVGPGVVPSPRNR